MKWKKTKKDRPRQKTPEEMDREVFAWSLPGDTQSEGADFLGLSAAGFSLWIKNGNSSKRERILLSGWSMLTDEQRARAMGA